MSSKRPEMRCPICGALYNVEDCSASTHATHSARHDERKRIVFWLRHKTSSDGESTRDLIKMLSKEIEAGAHEDARFEKAREITE